MFKDEVVIHVKSGKGGDGLVSFRREKFVPKGGPDGGDGGKGGDVVFVGDPQLNTLGMFHDRHRFAARNGQPGGSSKKSGKAGADLVLAVPPGTLVRDNDRGHVLKDIDVPDEPFVVLKGGRGGRGNVHFASSVNQTPRQAEKGRPGDERWIRLELKMIAHVGIIGLPNAGKSTLLSRISKATPKIADYPFTTLTPQLGIVETDFERYIFADIPGLIEGAHEGQGLGDQFLRHIERTEVLLHLIDCRTGGTTQIVQAFDTVMNEIAAYSEKLAAKPQIVALSKSDTLPPGEDAGTQDVAREIGRQVLLISAHSGQNVERLLGILLRKLDAEDEGEY